MDWWTGNVRTSFNSSVYKFAYSLHLVTDVAVLWHGLGVLFPSVESATILSTYSAGGGPVWVKPTKPDE